MLGIYFTGTGNTRHCVMKFVQAIDKEGICLPLESAECKKYIKNEDTIVFGYPIQYSNCPIYVRDYIESNGKLFAKKKIFIIATMGLFSGDGTGCSARLFRKCGAKVIGGLHLKMPDSVCDVSKLKKGEIECRQLIDEADKKIMESARKFEEGTPTKDGLSFFSHIAGLFGQRLWFYTKTAKYSDKLKINHDVCIRCGKCVENCPTHNLVMGDKYVTVKNKCTMCYRCIAHCPKQAITLIGNKVVVQYLYDNIK